MKSLAALPKAHLHLHLEAGMQKATLVELCAKYGIDVPVIGSYGSFAAFGATYEAATDVLRERADWERLADELCAEHRQEGAVYLEPAFWARRYRAQFGSDEACWETLLEIFDAAAARHGVAVRFMVAVDRVFDSPDEAVRLAKMAISLRDHGVVSFGLHNDEVGHPPGDFVEAFRLAKDGGLLITPHAGELDAGHVVADAVDLLGADRIEHGVRCVEVAGLPERLAELGICLDVCPTSNILLSVFPSFADHSLPALLEAGVRCSINADDPLLFGPGLLAEYQLCHDQFGLSDETMAAIARSSIECGGAPADVKAAALAGIDAWLAAPAA